MRRPTDKSQSSNCPGVCQRRRPLTVNGHYSLCSCRPRRRPLQHGPREPIHGDGASAHLAPRIVIERTNRGCSDGRSAAYLRLPDAPAHAVCGYDRMAAAHAIRGRCAWPHRTLSAAEADGRAATSERRQINEAWSVSHRQPELDLIVSFVELDERTAAIDTAGRGL